MSLASLPAYMGILAIAAASPGPAIAALVARVLGRGYAGATAFSAGLMFGDLVRLTSSIVGLGVLAQTFHALFVAVRWAGVLLAGRARRLFTNPKARRVLDRVTGGVMAGAAAAVAAS